MSSFYAVYGWSRYSINPNPSVVCLCQSIDMAKQERDKLNKRSHGRRYEFKRVKVKEEA